MQKRFNSPIVQAYIFAFAFASFFCLGCIFHQTMLEALTPTLNTAVNIVDKAGIADGNFQLLFAAAIFAKNISVVVMILIFGSRLFNLFSFYILAVNAVVMGVMYSSIVSSGVPYFEASLYFLPHGIIEIPAIIAACVLAISFKNTKIKEKLVSGLKRLVVPLMLAALVEVYITPAVIVHFI